MSLFLMKYLHIGEDKASLDPTYLRSKNRENPNCKVNCFRLLIRWISEQYFSINTMIQYNPSAIIDFYVSNVEKNNTEAYKNTFKQEYFKLV